MLLLVTFPETRPFFRAIFDTEMSFVDLDFCKEQVVGMNELKTTGDIEQTNKRRTQSGTGHKAQTFLLPLARFLDLVGVVVDGFFSKTARLQKGVKFWPPKMVLETHRILSISFHC